MPRKSQACNKIFWEPHSDYSHKTFCSFKFPITSPNRKVRNHTLQYDMVGKRDNGEGRHDSKGIQNQKFNQQP